MKKLIVAAAAVAMIGAAQATQFADYKASLKYVAMTKKTFKAPVTHLPIMKGDKISVLVKQVKSCTLKGYLVYDECACDQLNVVAGKKPAFLIVTGSAQAKEGGKKLPKILEADLLLNYWLQTTTTAQAEGYLFAGQGKNQRPWLAAGTYAFGQEKKYSTEFLFGAYNAADKTVDPVTGVQSLAFFNAWLDASGFGTAKYSYEYDAGTCGDPTETSGYCLNSLTGHVIGGMFNCRADWFEFAPCADVAWMGTTDVLTGTWSIKKNTKLAPVSTRKATEDGRFVDNTAAGYPAPILDAVKAATQKLGADGLKVYDQDPTTKQDWAEIWFNTALNN